LQKIAYNSKTVHKKRGIICGSNEHRNLMNSASNGVSLEALAIGVAP